MWHLTKADTIGKVVQLILNLWLSCAVQERVRETLADVYNWFAQEP